MQRATEALLAEQTASGYWVGELSSSALSTATAVTALAMVDRESQSSDFKSQIESGLAWLAQHQNADGGWGDTTRSLSNLSTTTLCWAAFGAMSGAEERHRPVVTRAAEWLSARAGGLEPDTLAPAIIARYGKDRTFSVPILTMCALAGRLGAGREAWRHVIPLPFELAACPHQFFAALRLPVVSYALPALISIGQARHVHAPSRNPLARMLRNATREKTLRVLTNIQPSNGGFLEATPLTSFVTMSLAGSGQAGHPVATRGVEFLLKSQRSDGSWPIDTNLATWVTTLAVNALDSRAGVPPAQPPGALAVSRDASAAGAGETPALLQVPSQMRLRSWLLAQQHRIEHPYTHAAPGGWAWTDLPGGVPDADDTAGAVLALKNLGPIDEATRDAAFAGIEWLLGVQNKDGGIPTFCRGWGNLPFDRSSADITAHALHAWITWWGTLPQTLNPRLIRAADRAVAFLCRSQRTDGAWVPLWFGNQFAANEENPLYGTGRVLPALAACSGLLTSAPAMLNAIEKATRWLLASQDGSGGWGGAPGAPVSVEETALAVHAMASVRSKVAGSPTIAASVLDEALARGVNWLVDRIEAGTVTEPSPIGFYFAKLWYFERLYPLIFTVGALRQAVAVIEQKPK